MTRDEAFELVGSVVRHEARKHGHGRPWAYVRLMAVVGDSAIIAPPRHGKTETVPLDALRRSVKHPGHRHTGETLEAPWNASTGCSTRFWDGGEAAFVGSHDSNPPKAPYE